MRGEVYRLRAPRNAQGHEQQGYPRYAVVVQADQFPLSTWLVAPTSTSSRPASFRPAVEINGRPTRVLAEQTAAVDPARLDASLGNLTFDVSMPRCGWCSPCRTLLREPAEPAIGLWRVVVVPVSDAHRGVGSQS